MIEQYQEEQRKKTARVRSVMDFVMGTILFLVGIFFLIYGFLDIKVMGRTHQPLDCLIGALFAAYGIWRIYRGYKKDYYR